MGPKCNHKCANKREVDGDRTTDRRIGKMVEARCYPAGFEDGGKGQEPKNPGNGSPRRFLDPLEGTQS